MKGVFSYVRYESGDVYIVNLLMKNIGIFVVFIATVFLSTKSIWAKLIYLDSLSPLSVLAYRALLSLPFFILPMIHFNWQSVNKKTSFLLFFCWSSSLFNFVYGRLYRVIIYFCFFRTCRFIYISYLCIFYYHQIYPELRFQRLC